MDRRATSRMSALRVLLPALLGIFTLCLAQTGEPSAIRQLEDITGQHIDRGSHDGSGTGPRYPAPSPILSPSPNDPAQKRKALRDRQRSAAIDAAIEAVRQDLTAVSWPFGFGVFTKAGMLGLKSLPRSRAIPPRDAPRPGDDNFDRAEGKKVLDLARAVQKEYSQGQEGLAPDQIWRSKKDKRTWDGVVYSTDEGIDWSDYGEMSRVHRKPGSKSGPGRWKGPTKEHPDWRAGTLVSDCSHFVWDVMTRAGWDVKYLASTDRAWGNYYVRVREPIPGDVVWAVNPKDGKVHMGIYTGGWSLAEPGRARGYQMGKSGLWEYSVNSWFGPAPRSEDIMFFRPRRKCRT